MQILNWVQNKFHGGQGKKRLDSGIDSSLSDAQKEEFSDWPQALLAIGTFGNSEVKEDPGRDDHCQKFEPSKDLSDFTIEEVNKLQKELKNLLIYKSKSSSIGSVITKEDRVNLPLNRFLNCPSSLEVDRRMSLNFEYLTNVNNGDISPNTKIILNKVKEMLLGNHNAIKKKSISFLLKKMFLCHSGFAAAPSLRDHVPASGLETMLRAIFAKKMQQQNSSHTSKKYLENKQIEKTPVRKEEDTKKDQCKWVKTDSDFIVLEI
ncbi:hypothetical protein Cni_G01926 [Canna indica]|uniref:NGR2 n=1 Tax=Canna indica TaxID=4628 RepID=A0AAQ3JNS1_9LILI|nr:hypothetical protein Cni_G01926 [Canna indica]